MVRQWRVGRTYGPRTPSTQTVENKQRPHEYEKPKGPDRSLLNLSHRDLKRELRRVEIQQSNAESVEEWNQHEKTLKRLQGLLHQKEGV